jgi:hypothetical protein
MSRRLGLPHYYMLLHTLCLHSCGHLKTAVSLHATDPFGTADINGNRVSINAEWSDVLLLMDTGCPSVKTSTRTIHAA